MLISTSIHAGSHIWNVLPSTSETDHGQYVNNRLSPIRWFQSIMIFFPWLKIIWIIIREIVLKKTLKKLCEENLEERQKVVTNSFLSSKSHQNPFENVHSCLISILNREMISVQLSWFLFYWNFSLQSYHYLSFVKFCCLL